MATCKNCGNNLDDNAKFCVNCGTPVTVEPQASTQFCTNCGAKLEPGVKFCTECGTAVESVSAARSATFVPPVVPPVVPPKAAPVSKPIGKTPTPPTPPTPPPAPPAPINNNHYSPWLWIILAILTIALIVGLCVYFGGKKSSRSTNWEETEEVVPDDYDYYQDTVAAVAEEAVADSVIYIDEFYDEGLTEEAAAEETDDDESYFSDRVSHVDVYGTWNQASVNVDVRLSTSSSGRVTATGKAYYNNNFSDYYTLSGNGTSNRTGCDLTLYEYNSDGTYTGRWEGRVYKTSDGKVNYYGYFYNSAGEKDCYYDLYSR